MEIGKVIIAIGLTITAIGFLIHVLPQATFLGKLPGDIRIQKENFTISVPLTTCLIVSATLSLILWILNKR